MLLTLHTIPSRLARLTALGLAMVGLAVAVGCSSGTAKVAFSCGAKINNGTLLTVDVVRATESEVEKIRPLGEQWFYSPLRESLRGRTQTATFSQEERPCEKTVAVSAGKEGKFLVIVADYSSPAADPGRYFVVLGPDRWRGRTLQVKVGDQDLSVVKP